MTFADLAAGDKVFVDANTLIYHFAPDPALGVACSQLLQRIENQELYGITSTHLVAEVVHKLMTIEANTLFGWPLVVALTQQHGITRLASHDADFDGIPGLTRYAPV